MSKRGPFGPCRGPGGGCPAQRIRGADSWLAPRSATGSRLLGHERRSPSGMLGTSPACSKTTAGCPLVSRDAASERPWVECSNAIDGQVGERRIAESEQMHCAGRWLRVAYRRRHVIVAETEGERPKSTPISFIACAMPLYHKLAFSDQLALTSRCAREEHQVWRCPRAQSDSSSTGDESVYSSLW